MEPRPIWQPIPGQTLARLAPSPTTPALTSPAGDGSFEIAAVLLVLQGGLGLVSAAGVVFLAALGGGAPLYLAASLISIAGPGLAILLARGLCRCRRWARNGTIAYEVTILLGAVVRVVFLREVAVGLVVTLTGVVLPLTVCAFVLAPTARRAIAHNRRAAALRRHT